MTSGLVFECGHRRAVVHDDLVSLYALTEKKRGHKPLFREQVESHRKACAIARDYAFNGKMNKLIKLYK